MSPRVRRYFFLIAAASSVSVVGLAADQKPAAEDFDHKFLSKVPHHHEGAVEMVRVCEQKAQHAELKAFCSKVATEQDQEKSQMETWRTSWYAGQEAHVPEMRHMQAKQKEMMAKLQSSSSEHFDHAFLMSMTEHHQDGMPEMKTCIASAKHSELKQLCRQMSKEQQRDIAQMGTWMKEWGGAAGSGKKR